MGHKILILLLIAMPRERTVCIRRKRTASADADLSVSREFYGDEIKALPRAEPMPAHVPAHMVANGPLVDPVNPANLALGPAVHLGAGGARSEKCQPHFQPPVAVMCFQLANIYEWLVPMVRFPLFQAR